MLPTAAMNRHAHQSLAALSGAARVYRKKMGLALERKSDRAGESVQAAKRKDGAQAMKGDAQAARGVSWSMRDLSC